MNMLNKVSGDTLETSNNLLIRKLVVNSNFVNKQESLLLGGLIFSNEL